MPRRKKTEEEIIEKIDEVNEKMKEINKEPIKKVSKPKTTKKQEIKEHKKDETFETKKTTKIGNFVDRSKYGSYNYFISLVRAAERMPRGRST